MKTADYRLISAFKGQHLLRQPQRNHKSGSGSLKAIAGRYGEPGTTLKTSGFPGGTIDGAIVV
jgi:hypothetical protein